MSYILEALRKADAERERERGAVPNLQTQLLPGASVDDESDSRRTARWLWPALGVASVLVCAVAWYWIGMDAPPPAAMQPAAAPTLKPAPSVPTTGTPTAEAVPASAVAPGLAAVPDRQRAAPATPPVAANAVRAAPAAPGAGAGAKVDVVRANPAPVAAPVRRADRPSAKASPKEAKRVEDPASSTADAQAPAARLPRLNELPEDLRRQMPQLAIGGSVYSPQAEKRMVIVNGQVFLEGAVLAPELQLEQIRPKSAVFSIRGQRFELPL
jgi:general secretion pathway protein B